VAVKARIGFLPEESYLYRFLVAHETLDYYGRLFRLPSRIRRDRTERLLDMVGLRHEARRPVGEYSKGMARRIGLAQALLNDPEFLILDEPTSGLDPIGARQIKDEIRELGNKGKTILLSSHVLADVEDVCDRVTILYGGQQRAAGDIGDLLCQRDVTQITTPPLSDATMVELKALIRRLEHRDILSVSHPRVKLEDYFLRIVEEAQAANIRTSGARRGGQVPEFLQKPTETTTHGVVESLVEASSRTPQFVIPLEPQPQRAGPGPSRVVLDELLGRVHPSAHGEPQPLRDLKPAPPPSDASRIKKTADASVIDNLLSGPGGPPKTENTPRPNP